MKAVIELETGVDSESRHGKERKRTEWNMFSCKYIQTDVCGLVASMYAM